MSMDMLVTLDRPHPSLPRWYTCTRNDKNLGYIPGLYNHQEAYQSIDVYEWTNLVMAGNVSTYGTFLNFTIVIISQVII